MNILLITIPKLTVKNNKVVPESYLPLGLISMATVLSNQGYNVEILDINKHACDFTFTNIPNLIMSRDPDVVGFSTMCNQYPTTLKLARSCKLIKPNSVIMLGGPQATITDRTTIEAFPFIDVIVRGECEQNITEILNGLSSRETLRNIPGLTFKDGNNIVRTPPMSAVPSLDDLPLPDYGLYPELLDMRSIDIEVGRGCPFECTFCSTSIFFKRMFRLRSPQNLITLIKRLSAKYGIKRFNFQHDNFTVNKKKVLALLNAIDEEGLDITWTCSSSLNTLDEELINRMASTGCEGIFIGFESGSPRMQKIIGKRLKLERSVEVIRHITKANISFTASFMMGFPEETMEDLLQTIALMTKLKFEGNGDELLQLHMLAPNPGTPLNEDLGNNLLFDNYFSDQALSKFTGDDLEMIGKHPDVFTVFYYYPTPHFERKILLRINYLISNMRFFPYTLYILWKDKDFDYPNLFIREISSLEMPNTTWDHVFRNDSVTNTVCFLTHVLNELGFREHYIHDVIKYEAAANNLLCQYDMQNTKSAVEEFNYDVEGVLMDISQNKSSKLPDIIKNDKHKILFMKNNSKVSTVRLHPKLSKLYWIIQPGVSDKNELGMSLKSNKTTLVSLQNISSAG